MTSSSSYESAGAEAYKSIETDARNLLNSVVEPYKTEIQERLAKITDFFQNLANYPEYFSDVSLDTEDLSSAVREASEAASEIYALTGNPVVQQILDTISEKCGIDLSSTNSIVQALIKDSKHVVGFFILLIRYKSVAKEFETAASQVNNILQKIVQWMTSHPQAEKVFDNPVIPDEIIRDLEQVHAQFRSLIYQYFIESAYNTSLDQLYDIIQRLKTDVITSATPGAIDQLSGQILLNSLGESVKFMYTTVEILGDRLKKIITNIQQFQPLTQATNIGRLRYTEKGIRLIRETIQGMKNTNVSQLTLIPKYILHLNSAYVLLKRYRAQKVQVLFNPNDFKEKITIQEGDIERIINSCRKIYSATKNPRRVSAIKKEAERLSSYLNHYRQLINHDINEIDLLDSPYMTLASTVIDLLSSFDATGVMSSLDKGEVPDIDTLKKDAINTVIQFLENNNQIFLASQLRIYARKVNQKKKEKEIKKQTDKKKKGKKISEAIKKINQDIKDAGDIYAYIEEIITLFK